LKIACLEEIAYRKGFIDRSQMEQLISETPGSSYRQYLEMILKDGF
jgi:glucose-1-phosphate thymidylyltransferase